MSSSVKRPKLADLGQHVRAGPISTHSRIRPKGSGALHYHLYRPISYEFDDTNSRRNGVKFKGRVYRGRFGVFEWSSTQCMVLGSSEQYRMKAQNYRACAATETDSNRRELFEVLADTFELSLIHI